MVAKTFQNYDMLGEPYKDEKGRMYIKVRNPKTQKEREVRWYSEVEYAKKYPDEVTDKDLLKGIKNIKPLDEVLGFENGYIWIFKSDDKAGEEWLSLSNARYHNIFGWYLPSTEELPTEIPDNVKAAKLNKNLIFFKDKFREKAEIKTVMGAIFKRYTIDKVGR